MLQSHETHLGDTAKHCHAIEINFVFCCDRMKNVSVSPKLKYIKVRLMKLIEF